MTGEIHIMGIVNLTPDSFYAGSRRQGADAVTQARQMLAEGADVIDLGACSTRPGSAQPSLEEEWARLSPVLQLIATSSPSADEAGDISRRQIRRPIPPENRTLPTIHTQSLQATEMGGYAPAGDSIPLRSIPAPPIVSCVPASRELVSNGPLF